MEKAKRSRIILNKRQKDIKKLVQKKISGMSKKEKLRAMTSSGIQELMDDAEAELKAKEEAE